MRLGSWCRKHRYLRFALYTLPILIIWFVLSIYPHMEVIPLSLYKWSPMSKNKEFVGLFYYKMLFTHQWTETKRYIVNTLLYVLYLFLIQTVLALLLALILQKNTRHNKFFRALFFLPMVFSSVMVSLTWSYMYDPNLGIINNILGSLGVDGYPGHSFFKPDAMAYDYVLMMGSRMTMVSFDTWASAIYKGITLDTNYGMVSAKSVLLFILMVVICVAQYLATKKAEDAYLG